MEPIHFEDIETAGATYRVEIFPDLDAENPLENWHAMGVIHSVDNWDHVSAVFDSNPDAVEVYCGYWIPDWDCLQDARNYGGRTRRLWMGRRARESEKAYRRWIDGEFCGFVISRVSACDHCHHETVEHVDSCWGFDDFDYCLQQARESAESLASAESDGPRVTR